MSTYVVEDQAALHRVLEHLLRKRIVEGIIVQAKGDKGVFTSLITDPEHIGKTVPIAPLFSTNTALYLRNNGRRKIGAVLKPCEARAVNELKKLNQIDLNSIIVICADCQGTIDLRDGTITEPLSEAKKRALEKDSIHIRNACKVCERFTPPECDISIMTLGIKDGYLLATTRDEVLEGLGLKEGKVPSAREIEIEKTKAERAANKEKMVGETMKQLSSPASLAEFLKNCIRCDNCRKMCPICYCKECYFETPLGDLKTDEMLHQGALRGILRIPPDILFYHLVRNMHVAASCVECGACEAACPREIPLLGIWKSLTGDVQGLFDYVSGMKLDEPLPFVKFKEKELEEGKSERA